MLFQSINDRAINELDNVSRHLFTEIAIAFNNEAYTAGVMLYKPILQNILGSHVNSEVKTIFTEKKLHKMHYKNLAKEIEKIFIFDKEQIKLFKKNRLVVDRFEFGFEIATKEEAEIIWADLNIIVEAAFIKFQNRNN